MNIDMLLRGCDCAIITSPAGLYYLSGFDQSDAVIVLTKSASYYLTNSLYEIAVKSAVDKKFIVKILSRKEITDFLRVVIAREGSVGVEYDDMTLAKYRDLFGEVPPVVKDLSPALAKLRLVKSKEEIALIKAAEDMVDKAFSNALGQLAPGVTEKQVKEALEKSLSSYGAEGTAFDTIVAFGENAAMPHAVPGDRALKKGDCVLMDFGAKYKGYCSDFTRTVCFGEPSAKFKAAYDVVLKAQRAAIEYIEKGGRSAKEADRIARDVIDTSPFRSKFNHTLGHGVGIMIHEAPALSTVSEDTLQDGMVFTVEPGVYLEGEFGIRIESLLVLENGKLTVIDRSDKEIYIV